MRSLELAGAHCPSCTCFVVSAGGVDPLAPGFGLVLAVQEAWDEITTADRAAGRGYWRPSHTRSKAWT